MCIRDRADNVTDPNTYTDYTQHTMMTEMNTIGYDWKFYSSSSFNIQPNRCYFVQDQLDNIWRLTFTNFGGTSTGNIGFNKELLLNGCTDSLATNYDPLANFDNGSCIYLGCTDSLATNYDPLATVDNGSCNFPVYSCNSNSIFQIPTTDIQIGTTTYDLQSNAAVDLSLIHI